MEDRSAVYIADVHLRTLGGLVVRRMVGNVWAPSTQRGDLA